MKKLFLLICLLGSNILIYCQIADTIEWRESYKLSWEDFKGPMDPKSNHSAATGASILYDVKNYQNKMVCIVKVYFERQRSWAKNNGKVEYVLRHEQGHFDIYEIYARKLRKSLHEKTFTVKGFERDFKKIVEKTLKKADRQQKRYDKQTGHSLKESQQQKWTKNISLELKTLEKYKDRSFELLFK